MSSISTPLTSQYEARRVASRFDWPLLLSALILIVIGLMSLYSVGQNNPAAAKDFKKQILCIVIGFAPFGIFATCSPKLWQKGTGWLYFINILSLVAVLAVGKHVKGAERWIPLPGGFQFQPSELAKLLTILTLSSFYAARQDSIHKLSTFLLGFVHILIPCILIRLQPHLGATLVVFVMFLGVSVIAGVPAKYLAALVFTLGLFGGVGYSVPSVRAKMFPSYQLDRMEELKNAKSAKKDVKKGNYQTDRAEIAFGVGGLFGTGYLHGEQKAAGFIPEQHNDFIVTVVGEEGGLIGCTLLLLTYGFFFYRIFLVMLQATNPFYKMVAAGIFAVLGFHTFVNMAMVLQLLPVVGLWLPFMSYGGTAIWLCMACVGLLLGIRRKQRPILF